MLPNRAPQCAKLNSLKAKFPTILGIDVVATNIADLSDKLWIFNLSEGDMTYIRQVTLVSLRAHVRQLLKKGTLHVGYLTTE